MKNKDGLIRVGGVGTGRIFQHAHLRVYPKFWEKTRLVLLQWEEGNFIEKAGTKPDDRFYSGVDFLSPPLRRGGGIVASLIEQEGAAYKDKVSRLILYRAE